MGIYYLATLLVLFLFLIDKKPSKRKIKAKPKPKIQYPTPMPIFKGVSLSVHEIKKSQVISIPKLRLQSIHHHLSQ